MQKRNSMNLVISLSPLTSGLKRTMALRQGFRFRFKVFISRSEPEATKLRLVHGHLLHLCHQLHQHSDKNEIKSLKLGS